MTERLLMGRKESNQTNKKNRFFLHVDSEVSDRGFESGPHHTKGVKYGTSSSLAETRIKGVALGR